MGVLSTRFLGDLLFCPCAREIAVIDFKYQGCQCGRVDWVGMGACTVKNGPTSICLLVFEKFVTNDLVVFSPSITTVINECLARVVVLVEVCFLS